MAAVAPENLLQTPLPVQKCTLGSPLLDCSLGGGIPCNSVTEIAAESGSGKTQLCLQLCLYAQLPPALGGLSGSSLFLHSELPFPSRRLEQLSLAFRSSRDCDSDPRENIFVENIDSVHHLLGVLEKMDSFIAKSNLHMPLRVIVVDSIAALFRSEYENTQADRVKRSSLFFKIASKLKAVAKLHNIAVVVTNQVVDIVEAADGVKDVRIGNMASLVTSGRRVRPALGLAWANCVNSRLFLSKEETDFLRHGNEEGARSSSRRKLHVVFSPCLPYLCCEFVIEREGIFGI